MSQAHEAMLDAALRAMTATTGPAVLPLRAARLTDTAAELYLSGPAVLPPPWISVSSTVWQADYEHLPKPSPGAAPFPALCLLGQDQEQGQVLLELQHLRSCRVAGDPSAVREVLAGLVVEAAMSAWGARLRLNLVGAFPDLEASLESGRIDYFATTADFFAHDLQPGLTHVVVVAGAISDHNAAQLQALLDSHPHVCLLCTDADGLPDSTWTLQLSAGGADDLAELQPLGLRIWPRRLPAQSYSHLLTVADEPQPVTAHSDAAFMPPAATRHAQSGPKRASDGPQVLMLGPVHLVGVTDLVEPTRRARLSELAAYLVLHPGSSASQLDEAIWSDRAGEDNGNTRNTTISKLRRWVGEDPHGSPWLPKSEAGRAGRYSFAAGVSSDIEQWQALIGDDPAAVSTADLEAAYGLLRGVPFEGTPARRYSWAEPVRQSLSAQIADVCAELGERQLAAGRWREAATVASFGQRTALGCERLWRIRIKGAALSGLPGELDEVESQLHDMEDRLGTDLEPATLAVLDQARATCAAPAEGTPGQPFAEPPVSEAVPAAFSPEPQPDTSETHEAPSVPVVPQQIVQVLPLTAPAQRRRGAGKLAAVSCAVLVAGAGGVWLAVQPTTETPAVAASQPAPPPTGAQPSASPQETVRITRAQPIHPAVIPARLKWASAADWQHKRQLADEAAQARAVPVPWNGNGTVWTTPVSPATPGSGTGTPASSGGQPSGSSGGGTSGGNSVTINPDPPSGGTTTTGKADTGLPDRPASPDNPNAQ